MYGRKEKIGILGGSFNPVHNGHLMIAGAAAEACDLDLVLFLPNPNPPHKKGQIMPSGDIRAQMTAAAIAGHPKFALSTYELRKGGICYTCETLAHFHEKYPDDTLYFIMGADSLDSLFTWKHPERIAELAVLCVACRDDLYGEKLRETAACAAERLNADIRLLMCSGMEVSSTRIRELAAAEEEIDAYVPPGTAALIRRYHLYQPEEREETAGKA